MIDDKTLTRNRTDFLGEKLKARVFATDEYCYYELPIQLV